MAREKFDSNEDYYRYLKLTSDASYEDIGSAYAELKTKALSIYASTLDKDKKETIEKFINKLDEAYLVLSDPETREAYDKSRRQVAIKKNELIKVNGEEILDDDDELIEEAKFNWKKLGLATAAGVLIVSLIAGAYGLGKHNSNKNNSPVISTQASISAGGDENKDTKENDSTSSTNSTENTQSTESNENNNTRKSKFYGDISDLTEVNKRASSLATELENAGVINITTGMPYSADEIVNLILYVNGSYVPENEQDVYDMYTEWLNFITGPLNTEAFIYQVNYQAGESSFKDIIDQNAQNPKTFDIARTFTFGQGNGYEYVEWLQQQYFAILNTTNEQEYNRIYNEVWQSFADIMKGNGYKFYIDKSEAVITEQELLQKGNIGIANQVSYWLFNFEPYRNTHTQESYSVVNKYISADSNDNVDTVSIDEMFEYINAVCDQEAFVNGVDYAVDDEGNSLNTMVDGVPGDTWGIRVQSNTKAIALEQLASKSLSK